MSQRLKRGTLLFTALFSLTALASPEKESVRIAGGLRAFSDSDWAKITGDHDAEKYEVARGDTLWGISARLFGDAKVWPKVWEINNSTVLNPHMIEPRMALVFNSGTGTNLPSLVIGRSMSNGGVSSVKDHYVISKTDRPGPVWDEKTPFPSHEWQNLPRQSWESVSTTLPSEIDRDGFDSKNQVYLRKPATGLEIPHFVSCAPVRPLGKIEGTRSITTHAYRGSEVTIQPTQALEVNRIYTLLDAQPSEIQTKARKALAYDVLGKVKVLGIQNGKYVGEVQNVRELVPRGALLVPEITRFEKRAPVAGSTKVRGTILADRRTGAFMSGQNKWVYVDRGTRDGVTEGMIFRIFQNQDPYNNQRLTQGDVFVQGDVQVIQGCEDFSIGSFVWSRGEVPERYEGTLLTDIADEKIRFYFNGEASDIPLAEPVSEAALTPPAEIVDAPKAAAPLPPPPAEIIGPPPAEEETVLAPPSDLPETAKPSSDEDWLDKLDNHKELMSEEENELRELEKFRESQTANAPAANPPAAPEARAPLPPPPSSAASTESLPPL